MLVRLFFGKPVGTRYGIVHINILAHKMSNLGDFLLNIGPLDFHRLGVELLLITIPSQIVGDLPLIPPQVGHLLLLPLQHGLLDPLLRLQALDLGLVAPRFFLELRQLAVLAQIRLPAAEEVGR